MKFMVSIIARPELTEPPGELMYRCTSDFWSSLARNRSWAITTLATSSSMAPPTKMMRSLRSRE
jgi:hypothetical protein